MPCNFKTILQADKDTDAADEVGEDDKGGGGMCALKCCSLDSLRCLCCSKNEEDTKPKSAEELAREKVQQQRRARAEIAFHALQLSAWKQRLDLLEDTPSTPAVQGHLQVSGGAAALSNWLVPINREDSATAHNTAENQTASLLLLGGDHLAASTSTDSSAVVALSETTTAGLTWGPPVDSPPPKALLAATSVVPTPSAKPMPPKRSKVPSKRPSGAKAAPADGTGKAKASAPPEPESCRWRSAKGICIGASLQGTPFCSKHLCKGDGCMTGVESKQDRCIKCQSATEM